MDSGLLAELVVGPATSGDSAFTRVNARPPVGSAPE
jgi:hypothetical protein